MEDNNKDLSVQEIFTMLEEVISKLEQNEIGLEDSFKLYEEGMKLLQSCNEKIDLVEKQVLELSDDGTTRGFV